MAVVPMQKVRVIAHQAEVDDFLMTMQRFGAMEFIPTNMVELTELSGVAPHAKLLPRVQHAVQFLELYEVKRGLWKTLREGTTYTYTEDQLGRVIRNSDATTAIVLDVEALQVELAEKTERVRFLSEQQALLHKWRGVSNRLADLTTRTTISYLVAAEAPAVASELALVALKAAGVTTGVETLTSQTALVTVSQDDAEMAHAAIETASLEIVERPNGSESAAVELTAVEEALASARGELGIIHDQAHHVAHTHLRSLRVAEEVLEWEQDRFAAASDGLKTSRTAVFDGWLMANTQSDIEASLAKAGIAAAFMPLALNEDEEPPVEIKNNKLIQPFEAVTRLYGMPGYKDLDPTLFLAGFFFLFFGLSLTDVGYGLSLTVISGGLLAFAKLSRGLRSMLQLLFYIGIATVLVGMLFGGYFGVDPASLPAPLQAVQKFDPIGNPLPVFYLALGLGVFQVMVGLLLKIYSDARNGKLLDGLWSEGPWLFLFSVGIVYVLKIAGYVSVATDTLVKLSYLGLGLLVIAAVRKSNGILNAVLNIGGSLYGSVGYLSDVLSYSRLLALGLATTALAFAVNLIAGIVYESVPYVGAVFALLILLIGHVFTLAVNTLGAFIHSARLQFVEFFGKFVAGTGRSFMPLTRTEKHITVAKE